MKNLFEELKQLETDDYQNRKGDYPKSNVPDSIRVMYSERNKEVQIEALFKNTDEPTAKRWLKRYLSQYEVSEVSSCQDGDYHDDWVLATACIPFDNSLKIENIIQPGRKGVTNAQMIPVLKEIAKEGYKEKVKLLKETYPEVFQSSLKYLGKVQSIIENMI